MLAKCVALLTMAFLATSMFTGAQDLSKGMARAVVSPHGDHGDHDASLAQDKASDTPSVKGSGKSDEKRSNLQVFPGGVADCQTRPLPDAGQLYRANYNKRERCFDEGSGSSVVTLCHECHIDPHGDDCWHGMSDPSYGSVCNTGGNFVGCCANGETTNCNAADNCEQGHLDRSWLKITGTGGGGNKAYKSYRNRAFVTSGGATVRVIVQDIHQENGTLAFYMDGVQFPDSSHNGDSDIQHEWSGDGTSSPASGTGSAALAANSPHEFVVVFTPTDPYVTSMAKIGMLYFEMDDTELSCKESDPANFGSTHTGSDDTCFDDLLDDDAIHLRTNNLAMRTCLEEPLCTDQSCLTACNEYKQCLEAVTGHGTANQLDIVTNMYLAAAPNLSVARHGHASCTLDTANDAAACFSPATADLQDLACQCKGEFHTRCNTKCAALGIEGGVVQPECLTAIACDHPKVCLSWKRCYCNPTLGTAQKNCQETHTLPSLLQQEEKALRKSIVMRRDTLAADSSAQPKKKLDQVTTHKCIG